MEEKKVQVELSSDTLSSSFLCNMDAPSHIFSSPVTCLTKRSKMVSLQGSSCRKPCHNGVLMVPLLVASQAWTRCQQSLGSVPAQEQ